MSTNFTGVTFPNQKVTPAYDAVIRRTLLDDGILTGCALTYSGSTLTMAAGQLMLCGRQIIHPSSQNWAVTEATTGYARLVLTIDLTRTSTKDTFDQVLDDIQYASAVDGFTALVQSDINAAGSKYQVAVCVVSLGPGGITGIVSQLDATEGGGAGGILTVTAPAGVAVTVSSGSKSKSKVSGASGVVTFKGLSTGTWTVSISDGDQTATRQIAIKADYGVVIAFFSATISITYPAGAACTATDGAITLTAPDASGTWECIVPNAGTWTVTCIAGDESTSDAVTITSDGQSESLQLSFSHYVAIYADGVEGVELTMSSVARQQSVLHATLVRNGSAYIQTAAAMDITHNSALMVTCSAISGDGTFSGTYASQVLNSDGSVVAQQRSTQNTTGTVSLDLSSLSGSYTIRVYMANSSGSYGGTCDISKIELLD